MGFDSNGNWSSDFFPITDRDNSVPILASKFQTLIQTNLKQSFENCILRDGTGKPNSNINFNSQKITNLADGTNSGDAVNKGQLDSAVAVSAGEETQGTIQIATEEEALAGTNDTKAMTPAKVKAVVDSLATTTRFSVNSGNAASGKPDLLTGLTTSSLVFKVDDGTSYKPLVATTAGGTSFSLESVESADVSALTNGTYNVFVDAEGNSYVYANVVYRQPNQPSSMNTNDIWFNTCEPFSAYIKTASELVECWLVQLPQTVTIASNVISKINTIAMFNDNGNDNVKASTFEYIAPAISADTTAGVSRTWNTQYTATQSGWVTMAAYTTDDTSNPAILEINGVGVLRQSGYFDASLRMMLMAYVGKGDKYKAKGGDGEKSLIFYPCKGVL